MSFPKENAWRCNAYLDWVKSIPSCISGRPADDAHHIKGHGMGGTTKAPDWATIPLTRDEHQRFHDIGWESWEREYGSQLEHVAKTLGFAIKNGKLRWVNS